MRVKANAEQAAGLWRDEEAAKVSIARGGYNTPEDINRALIDLVLDKVAYFSEKVITQLRAWSKFAVDDFFPPVSSCETPPAFAAEVPFATFVTAFTKNLEYGMNGAEAVCKCRVNHFRGELEAVQKSVEVCLRHRFGNLSPYSAEVRDLLLQAMNNDLRDEMTALATQGEELFRKHPDAAPPAGTGVPMLTPTFTRLREMVETGAAASLREQKVFRRHPPDT